MADDTVDDTPAGVPRRRRGGTDEERPAIVVSSPSPFGLNTTRRTAFTHEQFKSSKGDNKHVMSQEKQDRLLALFQWAAIGAEPRTALISITSLKELFVRLNYDVHSLHMRICFRALP